MKEIVRWHKVDSGTEYGKIDNNYYFYLETENWNKKIPNKVIDKVIKEFQKPWILGTKIFRDSETSEIAVEKIKKEMGWN